MKRHPMTSRGAEALRAELKRLKSEARPSVIRAIAEARGHGDLSENAEYHAAREQQSFIERRIHELEQKLASAEIIDPSKLPNTGRVVFGAVVELEDQGEGARVVYQIAGEDEADIRAGRISITSPIARALVGKREGDVVDVATPSGTRSYEIVATSGTARVLEEAGIVCRRANKVREGRPHIVDMIKNDEIDLIVNTTEGKQAIRESNSIRREAVHRRVTYYTTLAAALATCEALDHLDEVEVNRLADLHAEARRA